MQDIFDESKNNAYYHQLRELLTPEEYLAAYSGEQAISFVRKGLERVGWKVTEISWREIFLHDIRDSCDHITD